MNNTSTICQGYIVITGNKECFLILFCCTVICTLVKRFIFFVFQIFSFIGFQNFICRFVFFCKFSKNGVKQSACHIISISVCTFYFCVIFFRVYAECDIRRKSPRCGCPCKNVCIFIFHFETNDSRTLFDVLISLGNFLCRKWCSTTWTIRNDLKSFVKESLIPDFLQSPPFRLDKVVVISNIWIFHISPETYCRREILPHSFIFPDTFFTFIDKWFQTVFFNLIFSVKAEQLFYFQLYRQSVSIPSCLTRNHVALHCTVSRDHIFDYTCKNVSDMRFSICCRRSIVESISFSFFTVLHTFLENIFFIPEFFNFFFSVYKLQVCIHFFVLSHDKLLSESMTLYAFLGI